MDFEFDEGKSQSSRARHGIDFVEAQALWLDPERIEIPARTEDEPRVIVIGRIGLTPWPAIVTYREGRVRLISVRRARAEEEALYEGEIT